LERIELIESDLFAAVPPGRRFEFVVSNPPYVTETEMEELAPEIRNFEPRHALVAGRRGTEVIQSLLSQVPERLNSGGHLLMEISPMLHDAVRQLVTADSRFELGPSVKDLNRHPRVVQARRK
jgi:release factor glutamine methyltransferase